MAEKKEIKLPVLTSVNFERWKDRLLMELAALGLNECLNSDRPTEGKSRKNWEKKDTTAKAIIYRNLTGAQLAYVKNCETAKQMIKELENFFGIACRQSRAALIKELTRLRLDSKKDCEKHISLII